MKARLAARALALALGAAILLADTDAAFYTCSHDQPIEPAYAYTLDCERTDDPTVTVSDSGRFVFGFEEDEAGGLAPALRVVEGDFDPWGYEVTRFHDNCSTRPGEPAPEECLETCLNTVSGVSVNGGFTLDGVDRELNCVSGAGSEPLEHFELLCLVLETSEWSCAMTLDAEE